MASSSSSSSQTKKVIVVGAGPVGCLAALSLAKRGWEVHLYEGRPDMRDPIARRQMAQRSINLAISERGLTALRAVDVDLADRFLETVIPMKGRMIHTSSGKLDSQRYDPHGQCINSIDRGLLNEGLLREAAATPNVHLHFQKKLMAIDFDSKVATFRDTSAPGEGSEIRDSFDLCIGADGSYSNVRRQLMRYVRMDFQQAFIPHEYIELKMPPLNGEFALDPNHLHIWPRHSFMLIALPNKDKSFTCTLFAPTEVFDQLTTPESSLAWFKATFPDTVPLMGEQNLLRDLERNPRSPLIAIKAKPYHFKDRVVILGDAAHSMVPFYGQGLNCGLEDVRVLLSIMDAEGVSSTGANPKLLDESLARALDKYTETRHEDLVAICDLAMENYVEMRDHVTRFTYLLQRFVDGILSTFSSRGLAAINSMSALGSGRSKEAFPSTKKLGWLSQYTMVTFRPDISYSVVRKKSQWQSAVLHRLAKYIMVLAGVGIAGGATYFLPGLRPRLTAARPFFASA